MRNFVKSVLSANLVFAAPTERSLAKRSTLMSVLRISSDYSLHFLGTEQYGVPNS
jgi:hypothetical protein